MTEQEALEYMIRLLDRILDALEDIQFELHQINVRATNYDRDF